MISAPEETEKSTYELMPAHLVIVWFLEKRIRNIHLNSLLYLILRDKVETEVRFNQSKL